MKATTFLLVKGLNVIAGGSKDDLKVLCGSVCQNLIKISYGVPSQLSCSDLDKGDDVVVLLDGGHGGHCGQGLGAVTGFRDSVNNLTLAGTS